MKLKRYLSIIAITILTILIVNHLLLYSSEKNLCTLTKVHKIDDYVYLYNMLKKYYPFFELNKKDNNIDWLNNDRKYIKMIENTKNDLEFENTLKYILKDLNNKHTDLIPKKYFSYFIKPYANNEDVFSIFTKLLKKPEVIKRYNYKKSEKNSKYFPKKRFFMCDIIEPNKLAYLKVRRFDNARVNLDKSGILNFFKKVHDFPYIIIDIRGNPGGDIKYWIRNIVSPLISKPIEVEHYVFLKNEKYYKSFYDSDIDYIENIDANILRKIPSIVKNNFEKYYISYLEVEPKNSVGFNGKVFLLVDKKVYSAATRFASFCKASKWAKVIGENTGGGLCGGIDPVLISLPNSGYIIRFPSELVLNEDFTINEEIGVSPDIHVCTSIGTNYKEDKAIQKVLELINSNTFWIYFNSQKL
ncbi:peptidase family S41 [Clostridium tepidiprofundi DSM 19306]|uniref:Peptidase family S41 n=1 Tax=Clostridium tepidiprofundi DSM 19306 TaxID=1121338 RepID=A0A151B2Q5_9CLOT|nr:S41 family peptidase [Clostridium tepidiprofundi]KYH33947.1 peptidase family S41 [Clostridium tepidiprofundi DSM 19306]